MIADLAIPLRTAIVNNATIIALLPAYKGSFPVFTRRPAPENAPYPMILISTDVSANNEDGINDYRPIQERDVAVYGMNDTAVNYRNVETIARAVRTLFHRQRQAITVSGWHVVTITARGPFAAPTDDDKTVGRVVPLVIQLAKQA